MKTSEWWFTPLTISENGNELFAGSHKVYGPASEVIGEASPLTLDLRRLYVVKAHDHNLRFWEHHAKNDLLAVTEFQTGTSPTVQRFHFYEKNQEVGRQIGDLFKTTVCSFGDFKDRNITIRTRIYDIDSYDAIKEFFGIASEVARGVGSIFPVISKFLPFITDGAGKLVELIDQIDRHDKIIDSNLRIEIEKENVGYNVLQSGHWVCFSKSQEDGKLVLDSDLRIVSNDGSPFTDCDYVIYSIRKSEIPTRDWEIDQKIAKLLSELDGKGNSGKTAIEFLRETMEGYNKYKNLSRIEELRTKVDVAKKDLSIDELKLLKKLSSDPTIQSFIPNTEGLSNTIGVQELKQQVTPN